MIVIDNKKDLESKLIYLNNRSEVISLVPTMGNLHDGHLSLLEIAKKNSTKSIVSIFVNPLQFGQNEDFDTYPRTTKEDLNLLKNANCDILFLPKNKNEVFDNKNEFGQLKAGRKGNILCGFFRKGHFDGVLKVVYSLFKIINPNIAIFGRKDYQQLYLIEKMSKKYFKDLIIFKGQTIRNDNGLALSSRNLYLDKNQLKKAPLFYKFLKEGVQLLKEFKEIEKIKYKTKFILEENGFTVEYLEFLNENLDKFTTETFKNKKKLFLGSVKLGSTKLIDNIEFY